MTEISHINCIKEKSFDFVDLQSNPNNCFPIIQHELMIRIFLFPTVSAKGVIDGNQKIGTLSSRHKRAVGIIACFDFDFLFVI